MTYPSRPVAYAGEDIPAGAFAEIDLSTGLARVARPTRGYIMPPDLVERGVQGATCARCKASEGRFLPQLGTHGLFVCFACEPKSVGELLDASPGEDIRPKVQALFDKIAALEAAAEDEKALAWRLFKGDDAVTQRAAAAGDARTSNRRGYEVIYFQALARARRLAWLYNEPGARSDAECKAAFIINTRAGDLPVECPWADRRSYMALEVLAERSGTDIRDVANMANDIAKQMPVTDDAELLRKRVLTVIDAITMQQKTLAEAMGAILRRIVSSVDVTTIEQEHDDYPEPEGVAFSELKAGLL